MPTRTRPACRRPGGSTCTRSRRHKLGHVLGFNTSPFGQMVNGSGLFTGPTAGFVNTSAPPASADKAHWATTTKWDGQYASMENGSHLNTRYGFSALDFAGLRDFGWGVSVGLGTPRHETYWVSSAGGTTANVTVYSYANPDQTVLMGSQSYTVNAANGLLVLGGAGPTG